MKRKLFISYRRDDAAADAARIRDVLAAAFGRSSVFMDVDNLLAGRRFDKELAKALDHCDVLIAVLGPRWVEILKERLGASETDYVREEVSAALRRGIVVIPVRAGLEGRLLPLPRPSELPDDIRELVLHGKHDVVHETFGRDAAELVKAIRSLRKENVTGRRWRHIVAMLVALAVVAALVVFFVGVHPGNDATTVSTTKIDEPAAPKTELVTRPSAPSEPNRQAAPLTADDYFRKGRELFDNKDYAGAIEQYSRALELDPQAADIIRYRGTSRYLSKDYQGAVADHTRAIQLKPDDPQTYVSRGYAYEALNERKLSLADFTQAIRLKPDLETAYRSRGHIYYMQDQFDLALADYNQAIKLNPIGSNNYLGRGHVHELMGNTIQALADYNKTLELAPDESSARSGIERVLSRAKQ